MSLGVSELVYLARYALKVGPGWTLTSWDDAMTNDVIFRLTHVLGECVQTRLSYHEIREARHPSAVIDLVRQWIARQTNVVPAVVPMSVGTDPELVSRRLVNAVVPPGADTELAFPSKLSIVPGCAHVWVDAVTGGGGRQAFTQCRICGALKDNTFNSRGATVTTAPLEKPLLEKPATPVVTRRITLDDD